MSIKSSANKQEQYIIKDLFDGTYKVIAMRSVRSKGIEEGTLEDDTMRFTVNMLKSWGWWEEEKENVSTFYQLHHANLFYQSFLGQG